MSTSTGSISALQQGGELLRPGWATVVLVYGITVFLVLHASFRGLYADLDSIIYAAWYTELGLISGLDFWDRLLASGWIFKPYEQSLANFEIGFSVLAWWLSSIGMPIPAFYGIVAALSLFPKAYLALRYAHQPALAMLWYAGYCYLLLEMNAMRAGLAAALMLMSVPALLSRRWIFYVLLILIAASFHTSALAALGIPFLKPLFVKPRRLAAFAILSVALTFVDITEALGLLGGTFEKIADYKAALDSGFGDIAYVRLNPVTFSSVPFIFAGGLLTWSAFNHQHSEAELDRLGAGIYMLPLFVLFAFASFPIIGARLSELLCVYQMLFVTRLGVAFRRYQLGITILLFVPLIQLFIQQFLTLHVDVFYFAGNPREAMMTLIEQKAVIDAVLAEILSTLN